MALCSLGARVRPDVSVFGGLKPSSARRMSVLTPFQAVGRPATKTFAAEASQSSASSSVTEVENVSRDYCDDFECTSSPAVEQTVKAIATDLTRKKWTRSLFARDVEYKDAFRSFKGRDKYIFSSFHNDKITDLHTRVLRMFMLDKATAIITWELAGQLGPLPVDVLLEEQVTMNLVTGLVEKHSSKWDLSKSSLTARLAYTGARLLWSLQQGTRDAGDKGQRLLASMSMSGDEDDATNTFADPADPTKFFQQRDTTMQDAVSFATLLALFWLMAQAYRELAKL